MPEIVPQAKSESDRVLLLEAAVSDLQQASAARAVRDQFVLTTLIGTIGVLALFIVAYIHP